MDTTHVKNEADRTELFEAINGLTTSRITPDIIAEVFEAFPKALALWLKDSEPEEDGGLRGEMRNGIIVNLEKREERAGTGFSDGAVIPAHMALYIKAEKGLLDVLEATLQTPVKNG